MVETTGSDVWELCPQTGGCFLEDRGYWGGRGETRDVVYGKTQCANMVIDWSERNRRRQRLSDALQHSLSDVELIGTGCIIIGKMVKLYKEAVTSP